MKQFSKFLIVIILLAVLGGTFLLTRRPKKAEVVVPVTQNTSVQLNEVRSKINQLYANPEEKFFLRKEEIKQEELDALRDEISAINEKSSEKNKVLTEIEIVEWKMKALDAVNTIYRSEKSVPVIDGERVETEIVLANDLTMEKVKEFQTEVNLYIPTRLLDSTEKVQEDKFNSLALKMIDDAVIEVENFTLAQKKLKEIDQMVIEDGQIGNIAKAMREFENTLTKVTDKNSKKKLESSADQFVRKFMREFKTLDLEMPGYYEIVKVSVEPSKMLSKALEKYNQERTISESSDNDTTVTYEIVTESPSYSEPSVTVTTTVTEAPVTETFETEMPVPEIPETDPIATPDEGNNDSE